MKSASFHRTATAAATILLATLPSLTAALVTGPRHVHPRRVDVIGPRSESSLPSSSSSSLAPSQTTGGTSESTSGPAVDTFMLNILNRQKSENDLFAYIEATNTQGQRGFLVPPAGAKQGDPAVWFLPTGLAPTFTSEGQPMANHQPVPQDAISIQVARNTGGEEGEPPSFSMRLPNYIESGRVYLSEDPLSFTSYQDPSDPSKVMIAPPSVLGFGNESSFGFVELTWRSQSSGGDGEKALWANLSFVDWVGVVLGMSVKERGETDSVKNTIPGLMERDHPGVVGIICDEISKIDGAGNGWWKNLCVRDKDGNALRVISPNLFLSIGNPGGDSPQEEATGFYDNYVTQVWEKYKQSPLTVDTQIYRAQSKRSAEQQPAPGNWTEGGNGTGALCECKTETGDLVCGGECVNLAQGSPLYNETLVFVRPRATDIFSCNTGPFAPNDGNLAWAQLRARICAAFVRGTLLLGDGNVTPSTKVKSDRYYTGDVYDHYSKIVHSYLQDQRGYTFSFDDVNPDKDNAAGVIKTPSPEMMNIVVGGWKDGDELLGMS